MFLPVVNRVVNRSARLIREEERCQRPRGMYKPSISPTPGSRGVAGQQACVGWVDRSRREPTYHQIGRTGPLGWPPGRALRELLGDRFTGLRQLPEVSRRAREAGKLRMGSRRHLRHARSERQPERRPRKPDRRRETPCAPQTRRREQWAQDCDRCAWAPHWL